MYASIYCVMHMSNLGRIQSAILSARTNDILTIIDYKFIVFDSLLEGRAYVVSTKY